MSETHDLIEHSPRDYAACFAPVMAPEPRRTLEPAALTVDGRSDERFFLSAWRWSLPGLAAAADRESRELLRSAPIVSYRAPWLLAALVQRVFESRTAERNVLAWAAATGDDFWEDLGFPRRPSTNEVLRVLVPLARAPVTRKAARAQTVRRMREILVNRRNEAAHIEARGCRLGELPGRRSALPAK
jgi:hypothetical protein